MQERREYERVEYHVEIECSHVIKPDGSEINRDVPDQMIMLNLSLGGIAVVSNAVFEPGSILTFTLYLQRVPHTIMARVQWKSEKGEMNQYGLEFIGTPNQLFRQLKKVIEEQQTVSVEYA